MNWIYERITEVFHCLGLLSKPKTIVFTGLDNAGKTTLLQMLRSRHSDESGLDIERANVIEHDLGGMPHNGRFWETTAGGVDGIVFMIDAAGHDRIDEARLELERILRKETIANVPIVVLCNKIDRPVNLLEEEVVKLLGIECIRTRREVLPKIRPVEVFMCSVVRRLGYNEALRSLSQIIN